MNPVITGLGEETEAVRERLQAKAAAEQASMQYALRELAGGSNEVPVAADERSCLLQALAQVARAMGLPFESGNGRGGNDQTVPALADAYGLKSRQIRLAGEWWRQDAGPLLAFRQTHAVALIPGGFSGYRIWDP